MRKGLTFIELLVVLLIIGVLAGLASYSYSRYSMYAKRVEAVENLGVIRSLEEIYRAEKGRYVTCDWSPRDVPPPQGTTDWNSDSYFYLIGFSPRGVLRYRYAVARANGNRTVQQCMADIEQCYQDSVVVNGFVVGRDGVIDLIIKAESDLDSNGVVAKLFIPDEPPARVIFIDYSEF